MVKSLRGVRPDVAGPEAAPLRVISWNLLRLVGAGVEDVAALIARHKPDILLMQEATAEIETLPDFAGGHVFREPMAGRVYGLAVWSPHTLERPQALALPVSKMPGRVPPRLAQLVRFGGATFANVHLSHGQVLNRRQLLAIMRTLEGPAAIIGDYNAVGPIVLSGFKDVGPRQWTHRAGDIISVRLDRCMARGLACKSSEVLDRGPSDHHPIILDLAPADASTAAQRLFAERIARIPALNVSEIGQWVRTMSGSPERIRVPLRLAQLRTRRRRRRAGEGDHASR